MSRTTYSYDGNGNLLSSDADGAVTSYAWDEENRLTGVSYPDGTSDANVYNAEGMRVLRQEGAGVGNAMLWDGQNLLQESDDTGTAPKTHFTDGPGMWGNLSSQRVADGGGLAGGESRYYAFDAMKNTRYLLDGTGGVSDSYKYEGFGREVEGGDSDKTKPYRYGGQVGYYRDDRAAGERLYVRARHYDTARGRWMSKDPIGFNAGDYNLYRYVGNQQVNRVDPSGLWKWPEVQQNQYRTQKGKYCDRKILERPVSNGTITNPIAGYINITVSWKIHNCKCCKGQGKMHSFIDQDLICAAMELGRCCEAAKKYGVSSACVCGLSMAEQSWTWGSGNWWEEWVSQPLNREYADLEIRRGELLNRGCLSFSLKKARNIASYLSVFNPRFLTKLGLPLSSRTVWDSGKNDNILNANMDSCSWQHELLAAHMWMWGRNYNFFGGIPKVGRAPFRSGNYPVVRPCDTYVTGFWNPSNNRTTDDEQAMFKKTLAAWRKYPCC